MNSPPASSTAAVTAVASANEDTELLAANPDRIAVIIFNDSTAVLYVKFGTGASATSYTAKVLAGASYEMPGIYQPIYIGVINGFWAAVNGAARITELI